MTSVSGNLFTAGTTLTMIGQPTAFVSPYYGRMGGGFGMFGGCFCSPAVSNPIENAIWREQNIWGPQMELAKIMSGLDKIQPGGGAGSPGTTSNVNTNNYADCFNKLDSDKLHQLQAKEAEIDKLQEAFDKEKDKTKQKELAKQLKTAKADLAKLEQSYFKGTLPSQTYAKENFKYSNLSDEELKQIHETNAEIDGMKKEAESLKQQLLNKQSELERKRQDIIRRGGNPDDVKNGLSKAEIEAIDNMQAKYNELMKEISDKIDQLDKNIKEAGSNTDSIDFTVAEAQRSSAASGSKSGEGKQVAEKLFGKDGKLVDRKNMEKVYTKGPYKTENVKAVLDLIYIKSGCKAGMSKADVQKILKDSKFLKAIKDSRTFDSSKPDNVKLLRDVYDEIIGKKDSFEAWLRDKKVIAGNESMANNLLQALKTESVKPAEPAKPADSTPSGAGKDKPDATPTIDPAKHADSGAATAQGIKKPSEYTQKEINDAKKSLFSCETRRNAIETMDSNLLLAILKDKNSALEITQSFYEGDNDKEAIKALAVRLNEIAAESGIDERLFANLNWGNSIEVKSVNTRATRDVWEIDKNSDVDEVDSCAWSIWNNYLYKTANNLVLKIIAKQEELTRKKPST